jgi:hypothetical protein
MRGTILSHLIISLIAISNCSNSSYPIRDIRRKRIGKKHMVTAHGHLGRGRMELEVTPGLLAGAEPDAHQFNVTICFKGVIKWKETQNNIISTQKLGQACMNE